MAHKMPSAGYGCAWNGNGAREGTLQIHPNYAR
jgi:hypothetical protein